MTNTLTPEDLDKLHEISGRMEATKVRLRFGSEDVAALIQAAPALIAMARRGMQLQTIKDSCLKDWSENSLYGRIQLLERAEKAEAEAARYRDMVARLATIAKAFASGPFSDLVEKCPDIAALLAEEISNG